MVELRTTAGRPGRTGFTLVELLVAVGIVAALAGLLVPVLSQGRETARAVACKVNLHSIGRGIMLYTSENANTFPAAYTYKGQTASEGLVHWSSLLTGPGRMSQEAFRCPTFARGGLPPCNTTPDNLETGQVNAATDPAVVDDQAARCAYTVNEAICPRPFYKAGVGSEGKRLLRYYRYVQVAEVSVPAETILATEWNTDWQMLAGAGAGCVCSGGTSCKSYNPVHGFAPMSGGTPADPYDVSLTGPSLIGLPALRRLGTYDLSPDPTPPGLTRPRLDWVGRNHGRRTGTPDMRRSNFLYVEGHVETKSIYDTIAPFEWGERFYSLVPGNDIVR